jgi:thermitase
VTNEQELTPEPIFEGFAVKAARPGQEAAVREAVDRELGAGWSVRPFGDAGEGFEIVNAAAGALTPGEAWEKTYRLRTQPGVIYAEPLFAFALSAPPESEADAPAAAPEEAAGPESAPFGSIFGSGEPAESDDPDWSLREMNVFEAWSRFEGTGRLPGAGVVIGHPDTGYSRHPENVANLLIEEGYDFLKGDADAADELAGSSWRLEFPGHGTATASVIVSPGGAQTQYAGDPSGKAVKGVAPGAKLVPLRISKSVVLWRGSALALSHAIEYAADRGAHVISMSLGTAVFSERLLAAVTYAQKRGVIVLAAAGNFVRFVVWPAAFDEVIAVAASNARRGVWRHSSRGGAVDVTAPGEDVWCARAEKTGGRAAYDVGRGSGTSFAVAATAGVAALWLSFHGRERLVERYGAEKIPALFKDILSRSCEPVPEWGRGKFGAGLVNAAKVLDAPLPDGVEHLMPSFGLRENEPVNAGGLATFAHLFEQSLPPAEEFASFSPGGPAPTLEGGLAELLRVSEGELPQQLKQVGQELAFHFITDPLLYGSFEQSLQDGLAFNEAGWVGGVRAGLMAKSASAALKSKVS